MHYNENAQRPQTTTKQGEAVFKIAFPKSKQGNAQPSLLKQTQHLVSLKTLFKKIKTTKLFNTTDF